MSGGRYVATAEIYVAAKGREATILDKLGIAWREGRPHIACPYPDHDDRNPSWRWDEKVTRAFCTCIGNRSDEKKAHSIFDVVLHACKVSDFEAAKVRVAELLGRADLIHERQPTKTMGERGEMALPPHRPCNPATLAAYAKAKGLPGDFLRALGLADVSYQGTPAIRIPYFDQAGTEAAVRFRIALDGKDRFRWKKGDKPLLYGLGRLADARAAGSICLVEGESDTHTLWHAGFPAIGVPGGGAWREDRDAEFFEGIAKIHVVIEPDQGGKTVLAWLGKSRIRERAYLVRPSGFKDPSALYLDDPGVFAERWQGALDASPSWAEEAARAATAARAAASIACKGLLELPDILSAVVETLRSSGFVGEERAIKLIYLAVTSRLFSRIVSVAVKGASSGGKSYLVERVLSLFPEDAAYVLSALSERALAYSKEPLSHRMLVLVEAAGLAGKFATYLLRSLLSEGRIRYETVEKTKDGLRPKMIERAGPTGLIITTTAPRLHSENETRLISVTVSDTPEQTAAILKAQALRRQKESLADRDDLARWHALQVLLASGPAKVTIPFADALAELIPPVAVRLRRDFSTILTLIEAHALLHQVSRDVTMHGTVISTLDDYRAVRELVADLIADCVGVTVSKTIRETVEAVREIAHGDAAVTVSAVAKKLNLDKSAALRRVDVAIRGGFLRNDEDRKGRSARLVIDDPLPSGVDILPTVEALATRVAGLHG